MHNLSPCDEPKAVRIFTHCHNSVGYSGLKSNIQVGSGHCANEVPVRNWAKRVKISEWAMKQAQSPVHSTWQHNGVDGHVVFQHWSTIR
jgi:hypothetical protein